MDIQKKLGLAIISLRRSAGISQEEFAKKANIDRCYMSSIENELCMSRSGLFAKIRALTDSTPGEMIQLTRLKKAAQLLREGNMRISEICYQVGFSSLSYFTKCFTAQFGVKPSEFASQMNKSFT